MYGRRGSSPKPGYAETTGLHGPDCAGPSQLPFSMVAAAMAASQAFCLRILLSNNLVDRLTFARDFLTFVYSRLLTMIALEKAAYKQSVSSQRLLVH
jgi:hypothetical protein